MRVGDRVDDAHNRMLAKEVFVKMRVNEMRYEVRLEAREKVTNHFFRVSCKPIQRRLDVDLGPSDFEERASIAQGIKH